MNNVELFACKSHEKNLKNASRAVFEDDYLVYIENRVLKISGLNETFEDEYSLESFNENVIELKYISMDNAVCVVTEEEVIVHEILNKKVGTFKPGKKIVAASWNPHETTIVLIFDNQDVCEYYFNVHDLMWEAHVQSNIANDVPNSIYVGWGARETQFKGYLANQLYAMDLPHVEVEYSNPTISWRGNGEYFVVNYWKENSRYLKVFNAECEARWETKDTNGLLSPVSFKNEGNMIATVAVRPDGNHIIIFEKNCQPRHGFLVTNSEGEIKNVKFHPYLQILAIHNSLNGDDFLGIYYYINGKWYLKQQFLHKPSDKIIDYKWGTVFYESVCELFVITVGGMQHMSFRIMVTCHDTQSICAVIDGPSVYFSLFKDKIIPPPLSSFKYENEYPVNKILFHPVLEQCLLVDSALNLNVLTIKDDSADKATSVKVDYDNFEMYNLRAEWVFDELQVFFSNSPKYTVLGTHNVTLIGNTEPEPVDYDKIFRKHVFIEGTRYQFDLGALNQFFINHNLIANNVNSFFIYRRHLLYTTSDNRIFCIRINDQLQTNLEDFHNLAKYSRSLEQGGTIVCITASKAQTLLQMPRGNLELVSCQLMGVEKVEELLQEDNWIEAVRYIRMERLNWDLLIDLDIDRFSKHIYDFVDACDTPTLLSIACCDMKLENTLEVSNMTDSVYAEKKKALLLKIIKYIEEYGSMEFLSTIISITLKHFSLLEALKYLLSAFNRVEIDTAMLIWCEHSVQQLKIHTDTTSILKACCLLYNLDFLKFIMALCNFDPMDYEPRINYLRSLSEIEIRYEMSVWADNKEAAAGYMVRMSKFDVEFVSKYISKNNLQEVAYKFCPSHVKYFPEVSRLYGHFLSHRGNHEEGGFVLKRAELHQEALNVFKLALNWQQVLLLANKLLYTDVEKNELMETMAQRLIQNGKVLEGVGLYENYLKEYVKAIYLLIENKQFSAAVNVALLHKLHDTLETKIKPAIDAQRDKLVAELEDRMHNFNIYLDRLKVVREGKKTSGEDAAGNPDVDMFSDTETVSSMSSASKRSDKSTQSARGRRKEERKKIDLKPGGKYEDIALVRALYILINEVFNMGDEVKDVCMLNDCESSYYECFQLHNRLIEVQTTMIDQLDDIWIDLYESLDEPDPEIQALTENFQHLDIEYRCPPMITEKVMSWRMSVFK